MVPTVEVVAWHISSTSKLASTEVLQYFNVPALRGDPRWHPSASVNLHMRSQYYHGGSGSDCDVPLDIPRSISIVPVIVPVLQYCIIEMFHQYWETSLSCEPAHETAPPATVRSGWSVSLLNLNRKGHPVISARPQQSCSCP